MSKMGHIKNSRIDRIIIITAIGSAIITIFIRFILLRYVSINISGDSNWYISNMELFAVQGLGFVWDNLFRPTYIGYPLYLHLFRSYGENQFLYVVITSIVLSISVSPYVFWIARQATGGCKFPTIALVLYMSCWEIFHWDYYILSDTLGVVFAVLSVGLLFMLQKKQTKKLLFSGLMGLSMLALLLVRGNGIMIVIPIFSILLLYTKRRKTMMIASLCAIISIVVLLYFQGIGRSHSIGNRLNYYIGLFRKGVVVLGRPEYNVDISYYQDRGTTQLGYLLVFLKRIMCFWLPTYATSHSVRHQLYGWLALFPVFVLAAVGSVAGIIQKNSVSKQLTLFPLAATIVSALTELEYDSRYRIIVLPFVIILAVYGLKKILDNGILVKSVLLGLKGRIATY